MILHEWFISLVDDLRYVEGDVGLTMYMVENLRCVEVGGGVD